MRTTIDLPNEMRARLAAMAARRGLRGYSELVVEALERYLNEDEEHEQKVTRALSVRGAITDEAAKEAEARIEEAWARWR